MPIGENPLMKTKIFVLILAVVAETVTAAQPLAPRVDAFVKPYLDYHLFNGVVLATRGDKVLFEKAYGMANYEFGVPNTMDTRFAIASITKRFTSVVLENLFAEKKLSPEDLLSKWVPDFPSADAITIQHLMTHKSGLRDPNKLRGIIRQNMTSADVVNALMTEPLGSKPGEVYSYTTANYAILGHIIERVTGQTYAEVVKKYVYDRAKMRDSGELTTTAVVPRLATGYAPDPSGRGLAVCGPEDTSWKIGGGSSYSTARDLRRFAHALFDGTLLPKDVAISSWPLGTTFGKRSTSLSGAFPGAGANLLHFVDDDVTVIVLTNNYSPMASNITQAIAAMIFDQPYTIPSVKLAADPYRVDPRIVGHYRVEGRPWQFTVMMRDGHPIAAWTPVRQSAMLRVSEDTWFEPFDWATVKLKFDDAGKFVDGALDYPGMGTSKITRD